MEDIALLWVSKIRTGKRLSSVWSLPSKIKESAITLSTLPEGFTVFRIHPISSHRFLLFGRGFINYIYEKTHYAISWGVGNRHWRLPDGVHLCVFYSTIPAVAPLTLDCVFTVVLGLTVAGLQGSEFYKARGGLNLLMIVCCQLQGFLCSLLSSNVNITRTHALPGKGWFPRWGGHDPGNQGKARSLFGPHRAASLLTQSLVLTCLFPCALPPKRGTKPEIWGLQHESSAVIQNPSWRIHTQLLTCLSSRSALPASSPFRSR